MDLTNIPTTIIPGDTYKYTYPAPADYPPDEWAFTTIVTSVSQSLTLSGVVDGSDWEVTLTAAQSASLAAGYYGYAHKVSLSGEVHTIETGSVTVKSAVEALIARSSHAQRALDAIEAVLENRIDDDVENYVIAGRDIRKLPMTELLKLRNLYKQEVINETRAAKIARGEYVSTSIKVRLV